MKWFHKIIPSPILGSKDKNKVPEGLWEKCDNCSEMLYRSELEKYHYVCKHCDSHIKISARARLQNFLDKGSSQELFTNIAPLDPLKFKDLKRYPERISTAQKTTQEKDALVVFKGAINGMQVIVAAFDFNFMGGHVLAGHRLV